MKNNIYSFVLGAVLISFGYFVYSFYQIRTVVATDHATLAQIVQLIQSSQKQAEPNQAK